MYLCFVDSGTYAQKKDLTCRYRLRTSPAPLLLPPSCLPLDPLKNRLALHRRFFNKFVSQEVDQDTRHQEIGRYIFDDCRGQRSIVDDCGCARVAASSISFF